MALNYQVMSVLVFFPFWWGKTIKLCPGRLNFFKDGKLLASVSKVNACISVPGRLFGETKSRQASWQLYHDPEELQVLERAPPLPEDEAVCDPHSGLGTRVPGQKVCTRNFVVKTLYGYRPNCKRSVCLEHLSTDWISRGVGNLSANVNSQFTKAHSSLELDGEDIENVEDFQYLSSYIASTGKDIKYRKGKAWSAFWKLDRVWKSPASLQQKVQLFKASALSVVLYGCESWVLTSDLCRQLDSFQTSCFRIILVFLVLIMLAARKFMIEREQSPFPNQPERSDSWAIVFGAPRGTLFLNTLCTTRHMVNQDLVDVKFYSTNVLQS